MIHIPGWLFWAGLTWLAITAIVYGWLVFFEAPRAPEITDDQS